VEDLAVVGGVSVETVLATSAIEAVVDLAGEDGGGVGGKDEVVRSGNLPLHAGHSGRHREKAGYSEEVLHG